MAEPPRRMTKYNITDISDEMSRFSYWLGEAYFWLFMILASWTALSGAPWYVAFWIGGALTFGNLLARWGEWRDMIRQYDTGMMFLNWGAVYAWQTTVILITFAVARYLRRFVPDAVLFRELQSWTPIVVVLFVMAFVFGMTRIADDRARKRRAREAEEAAYQAARKAPMDLPRTKGEVFFRTTSGGARQQVSADPLTYDTLYVRYASTHQLWTSTRGLTGFADLDKAESSEERIAMAEARLGLEFPDDIRRCYLRQNGGGLGAVFYETEAGWEDAMDHLLPLEKLGVLADRIGDDPVDHYPNPAQTLIIAQDDFTTLLVDLQTGAVTLEQSPDYTVVMILSEDDPTHRWSSFAAYLNSLHRVLLTVGPAD